MLNSFNTKGRSMFRETVLLFCVFPFLFAGCSSKEEQALMAKCRQNRVYYKKLFQTEKIQLCRGGETKLLLTATYRYRRMDLSFEEDQREEVFIVGIYREDDTGTESASEDFTLTLNGREPIRIKRLDSTDKRLKDMPFVTEWGSYFEVNFPHSAEKKFDLVFKSTLYGEGKLHFAKKAKYLFSKEVL